MSQNKPSLALVGRPNVGKSTLFNLLTRSRDALVFDMPGITRDKQYGEANHEGREYIVVDTGGIGEPLDNAVDTLTQNQVSETVQEVDHILFMVDAKTGITVADNAIAEQLRSLSDKVTVVMNKADNEMDASMSGEFYGLGLGEPHPISAKRRGGVSKLIANILGTLPESDGDDEEDDNTQMTISVIGRPNVGKSTLVNRILGENRVMVLDRPGTTRDSIYIPFERNGEAFTLIDTAGVRRRARVNETIEKFSILKTMEAMKAADVVVYLFDATEGVTDQDMQLLGLVMKAGPGVILAYNKWDSLDEYQRECFTRQVDLRLGFMDFARRYHISALHGSGIGQLFTAIKEIEKNQAHEYTTSSLTTLVQKAVRQHEPPMSHGRRIKPRFFHVGGRHPLAFILHGKQVESLPADYLRFLIHVIRKTFELTGIPIVIYCRNDENPYKKEASH